MSADSPDTMPSKPKKSVGFAPPPEDLQEHHENLRRLEEEKKKGIPFHRMPPELRYLEKIHQTPGPKPIVTPAPVKQHKPTKMLGDLKRAHVKDISVINKDTEVNFNFPHIDLPIPNHNVLVSVKYGGLNSFDISKLNKYAYNLSDYKVGLGYEFVGEIVDIGSNVKELAKGDYVLGIVSPYGRKGALSSSLLLNPAKDFLVKLDEMTVEKLESIDPYLRLDSYDATDGEEQGQKRKQEEEPKEEQEKEKAPHRRIIKYKVEDQMPTLAKPAVIPVLYCKAKQALQHLSKTSNPKLLINGADTNLGFTLIQLLVSSLYEFESVTAVLVVKESHLKLTKQFVTHIVQTNTSLCEKNLNVVSYDLVNEDIVLPGEKTPVNYKKPDLMAVDILDAMLKNSKEKVSKHNINDHKLDLIIDIVGSHCLHKTSIRYKKLDYLQFPVVDNIDPESKLSQLFKGNVKEPFFVKLLKPKSHGSGYVSFCKFNLSDPSYSIDKLIDASTQSSEQLIFNPWQSKWGSGIANSLLAYNYYDEINLQTSRKWIIEGLNLFLKQELQFKIDDYLDWRDFKPIIKQIRKRDEKYLFKVEDF